MVKIANERTLHYPADYRDYKERSWQAEQKRKAQELRQHISRIRAEHNELAMGHVDNTHGPIDDCEPQCREQPNAGDTQADKQSI